MLILSNTGELARTVVSGKLDTKFTRILVRFTKIKKAGHVFIIFNSYKYFSNSKTFL